MKSFCVALVVSVGVFCLPAPGLTSPASSLVPLDSWIYPALDKLTGLGLVESALQGTRPVTRLEAARQVAEAVRLGADKKTVPVVQGLFRRLESELRDQLEELSVFQGATPDSYLKPLRNLEIQYVFQDGELSSVRGSNAHQFALNYNNFGIDYDKQHNAQLTFVSEARLARFFLLELRPILGVKDQDGTDLDLLEGRAAVGLGPFEMSVGRQSLWWGQGRHGSLVLTNNAEPLDMLRITNPMPLLLPGFLKYLGPFRFDLFWSRLEEEREVPEPYFAGLRLNFKPLPWFELGASRTVMFGGQGRPDVNWDDFITILGGKNLSGNEDTSNSVAAFDARLRLPFLWGVELYGELGGEDEAGYLPSKNGYIAGLYLPKLEPSGRLSLRLEHADLHKSTWYRHSQYRSGYTYEGKVMGHHAGGAARDTYVELQAILSETLLLTVGLDYEERGLDQPVREEQTQGTVSLSWDAADHYSVDCTLGYGQVDNFNSIADNNEELSLLTIGFRGHW